MVLMIILLILCLPLILMLSLFTTTSVVSIVVDVPVNGIDVVVEEVVELDLDKGESFTVEYLISPTEAKNKDVTYTFTRASDGVAVDFIVDGNTITPTSAGHFRVTLETVDGGYRDSFDMIVRTRGVESITSTPKKSTITVGEYTDISTEFYPKVVTNEALSYRVKDGEGIVTVSGGGKIQGIGVGTATVEVTSADNPNAKSEFTVTVESSGVIDFVNDRSYLTALEDTGSISAVINPAITLSHHSIELFDENGALLDSEIVTILFDTATGALSYTFIDQAYVGLVEVRLTVIPTEGEAVTKSCYIERISRISIAWADLGENGEYAVSSTGERINIDLRPLGANVSYKIKLVYTSATDVVGEIESDIDFDLTENVTYKANGGYVSIMLESTPSGVCLVVNGTFAYDDLDDINKTLTEITLTVTDENNGNETVLDKITVVVF